MEVIGDLPRELFLEILLRLPAESLIRCRYVCKYWRSLVTNPKFIELHLEYNKNNNLFILLKHCLVTCLGQKENLLSLVCTKNGFSFENLDVDSILYKKEPCLQLLGHCDGIICLTNYRDYIVLCNPATRESMVLPAESSLPCYPSIRNLISQTTGLGFGYDAKCHRCKVVRIVSYWEEIRGSGLPNFSRVEVYTVGTDSWKEIDVNAPAYVRYSPCFETYFNGAFHWYAVDDNGNEVILSFDMGNEEFRAIHMPSLDDDHSIGRSLLVWNGCLALVTYPGSGIEKSFEISVMKEYGVKESWTNVLTIGPLTSVERPLVFGKNDEILMVGSDGQMMVYNLRNKELMDLPIHGIPNSFAALVYVNSLVSLKGWNQMLDQRDNTDFGW